MTLDDKTNRRLDRLSYICLAVFIGCLAYVMYESITEKPFKVEKESEPFLGLIDGVGYFTKVNETVSSNLLSLKIAAIKYNSDLTTVELHGYNTNDDYTVLMPNSKIMVDDIVTLNQYSHTPICTHDIDPHGENYPDGKPKYGVLYDDRNTCPPVYYTYSVYTIWRLSN